MMPSSMWNISELLQESHRIPGEEMGSRKFLGSLIFMLRDFLMRKCHRTGEKGEISAISAPKCNIEPFGFPETSEKEHFRKYDVSEIYQDLAAYGSCQVKIFFTDSSNETNINEIEALCPR
jgi:hypothetical protein